MRMEKMKPAAAALLAAVLAVTLCSCDTVNGYINKFIGGAETTEKATERVTDAGDEAETDHEPIFSSFTDPLTGEERSSDFSKSRPVAIVIKNDRVAAPQPGISDAGIIYEANVEGGLTRLLAVYSDVSLIDGAGPVIDARTYFYDFAANHGAAIAQAGTTAAGRQVCADRKIVTLDAISGEMSPGFERNATLSAAKGPENSILASGKGLQSRANMLGLNLSSEESVMPYKVLDRLENREMSGGKYCTKLSVPFSSNMTVSFAYSTLTDSYARSQYGQPHIDARTGNQIKFTNLIFVFTEYSVINKATGEMSLSSSGQGSGYYIYGGSYIPIVWKRSGDDNRMKLYETDGNTPLTVSAGNTYIAVTSTSVKAKISFE